MGTGFDGTFVLSTLQTEYDGFRPVSGNLPQLGQIWTWQGMAVRMDGPNSTYVLGQGPERDALRERIAKSVRRRLELSDYYTDTPQAEVVLPEGFVISDGQERLTLLPVSFRPGRETLLICVDGVPHPRRPYTVIRTARACEAQKRRFDTRGDVICFTEQTLIRTADGEVHAGALRAGQRVLTRDNGPQEVVWVGQRHFSGARLHAMPDLRPVRIRTNVLGSGRPDGDLLVSPHHRLLYAGKGTQALFNTPEVLVTACDIVNNRSILVDHTIREVTYVHLMFAEHQVVWANGVPSESFHPAQTSLETLSPKDREALIALYPEIAQDLHGYGPFARRRLSKAEAAILLYDLA